jgi:hypothetical protein
LVFNGKIVDRLFLLQLGAVGRKTSRVATLKCATGFEGRGYGEWIARRLFSVEARKGKSRRWTGRARKNGARRFSRSVSLGDAAYSQKRDSQPPSSGRQDLVGAHHFIVFVLAGPVYTIFWVS